MAYAAEFSSLGVCRRSGCSGGKFVMLECERFEICCCCCCFGVGGY
jgi:hypothetical protein